jgi:hypothetical protein
LGTFPGLALFTAVLAFNVLGDSLRDVFDPRTAWRGEAAERPVREADQWTGSGGTGRFPQGEGGGDE